MTTFDLGNPPRSRAAKPPGGTPGEDALVDAQYTLYLATRKRRGLGWLSGRDPELVAEANAEIEAAQAAVDDARAAIISEPKRTPLPPENG